MRARCRAFCQLCAFLLFQRYWFVSFVLPDSLQCTPCVLCCSAALETAFMRALMRVHACNVQDSAVGSAVVSVVCHVCKMLSWLQTAWRQMGKKKALTPNVKSPKKKISSSTQLMPMHLLPLCVQASWPLPLSWRALLPITKTC